MQGNKAACHVAPTLHVNRAALPLPHSQALPEVLRRVHGSPFPCPRVHFRRLVFPWTDVAMGNCSYLDTCRHMKTCRYVHYELDDAQTPDALGVSTPGAASSGVPAGKPRPAVPKYLAVRAHLSITSCYV